MQVSAINFSLYVGALSRAVCEVTSLLGAGVFGDGFGALADGVLGQLTGEQETDSSLDFSARDGGPAVVVGKSGRLSGNALEDVVHERVHDAHGLAGHTSVGVHLLQHLVDVFTFVLQRNHQDKKPPDHPLSASRLDMSKAFASKEPLDSQSASEPSGPWLHCAQTARSSVMILI